MPAAIYAKCAASGEAITLLAAIPAKRQEQPKLKSAILDYPWWRIA